VVFFDGVAEPVLKFGCSYGAITAVILRDNERQFMLGFQMEDGAEMSEEDILSCTRTLVQEYLKFLRKGEAVDEPQEAEA
jgi:hypothetical protein